MCTGHLSLQHLEEGVADLDDLPDVAEEDGGLDPLLLQQVGGVQGECLGYGWRRSRQGRANWIQGCTSLPSTFGAGWCSVINDDLEINIRGVKGLKQ